MLVIHLYIIDTCIILNFLIYISGQTGSTTDPPIDPLTHYLNRINNETGFYNFNYVRWTLSIFDIIEVS